MRVDRRGRARGVHGRDQGLARPIGDEPVVGELGGDHGFADSAAVYKVLGDRLVDPGPLPGSRSP